MTDKFYHSGEGESAVTPSAAKRYENLLTRLRGYGRLAVAFSGGADSAFLLYAARQALGDNVLAVTADTCFFPRRERDAAAAFCEALGVAHRTVTLDILAVDGVRANPENRCYLCKRALLGAIADLAKENGFAAVAEGSNLDDAADYRPGQAAIRERGIASPLRDAGFTKAEIRACSRELGLSTWDKPALACLASRVAYGQEITPPLLDAVDRAEELLRQGGFLQVRVRAQGNTARIEVAPDEIARLAASELCGAVREQLHKVGFAYAALDLDGYRTGSMNETLRRPAETVPDPQTAEDSAENPAESPFARTQLLLGCAAMRRLQTARVAVFGVGGVGGYAVEALARSGVGALDLIDGDVFSPTNLNRQLHATFQTIGQAKVEAAAERLRTINPALRVTTHRIFYSADTADRFDLAAYDYIVDAIDDLRGKIELIVNADRASTPIISSMGAGNKLDPTAFAVTDLSRTSVCPLARLLRRELRRRGITKLKVVSSREPPRKPSPPPDGGRPVPGSTAFVPSVVGLILAGEVVRDLTAGLIPDPQTAPDGCENRSI